MKVDIIQQPKANGSRGCHQHQGGSLPACKIQEGRESLLAPLQIGCHSPPHTHTAKSCPSDRIIHKERRRGSLNRSPTHLPLEHHEERVSQGKKWLLKAQELYPTNSGTPSSVRSLLLFLVSLNYQFKSASYLIVLMLAERSGANGLMSNRQALVTLR